MTTYHAATIHPDHSVTYCGTVDHEHVETARAIAALPDTPQVATEHHRRPGTVFVLRDDGNLDVYEPADAEPFARRSPDPHPRASVDDQSAGVPLPRGASGITWIPGAIRLGDGDIGGAMDTPGNPPRVVHHTTETPAGGRYLESVGSYLIEVASEPQLIYDPVSDRVGQFGPLNESGRALKNDRDGRRTNREGRVCIQIEVLGYASHPWTTDWDPAQKPGWQKILAAARSWGVPDAWPAGPPAVYPGGDKPRSRSVWQNSGGHYGHVDVPGNDHGDPGRLDTAKVLNKGGTPTPTPSTSVVALAHVVAAAKADPPAEEGHTTYKDEVQVVEDALVDEGLLDEDYADGSFGSKTVSAYAAWQCRCGFGGRDADGIPGLSTLTKLGAAHGFTVTS
ncbi:peptidoglycan-binding domain-containing protein [Streptomyces sp. NPDC001404]|uniref:peptidoglycan-binding domain-containing protein n=1 Tax=Streptomyces sp. NPDC001404 TaxID=3364571 RepID=UPI0036CA8EA8